MATASSTPRPHRRGRPKGWRKGVTHSKMVGRRAADTRALLSSIDVFKSQATKGLSQRLTPELAQGETLPDFGLSLDLFGRSVESAFDRLRAAERRYLELGVECASVRRESEKLARHELYPRVVSVRRLIESQFGQEEGRRVHGMVGKTRRKPWRLHGQVQYLVWMLKDGGDELPEPLLRGVATESEAWLREIQPSFQRLSELLDDLVGLQAREQGALIEKQEAMQAFDEAYGETRRWIEASFAFAGLNGNMKRHLKSYSHRRFLAREARRKRQARAEGQVQQTLRSAASSIRSWISRGAV